MLGSYAHAEVHEAGTATVESARRSLRIAAVPYSPIVWASASTLPRISSYARMCVVGFDLLSRTYVTASISCPPMPPARFTRSQNFCCASVTAAASAARGPTVRSEMIPR